MGLGFKCFTLIYLHVHEYFDCIHAWASCVCLVVTETDGFELPGGLWKSNTLEEYPALLTTELSLLLFETGCHIVQAGLKLLLYPWLTLNS